MEILKIFETCLRICLQEALARRAQLWFINFSKPQSLSELPQVVNRGKRQILGCASVLQLSAADWDGESPSRAWKQTLQMFCAGQVDPLTQQGEILP